MQDIEKNILRVICYYDIFNYPLTQFEIFQKIDVKTVLGDVLIALDNIGPKIVGKKNGFYYLAGRENLVSIRSKRYNYTLRKIKRAKLIAHIFEYIPYIKLVAIGNLIGAHNLKNEGDIDLFIVTEVGAIWTTRFITATLMKLLGLRPKKNNQKDKICLSFFVTENALNLTQFAINKNDIYLNYWLSSLYPIYDKNDTYNKLINQNKWIFSRLPNWIKIEANPKYSIKKINNDTSIKNKFFNSIENILHNIQLKILPTEITNNFINNSNVGVVVNSEVLKFHTKDKRLEYYELYLEKWNTLKKNHFVI
ncbi:hypothetical protein ISS03_03230 [Patescibacteria group bacterium]|nr:hypothetical protein [Patescibacteria group bacterium]